MLDNFPINERDNKNIELEKEKRMTTVRSMRGVLVDMGKLFRENQETVAITGSNIRMNARGDLFLPDGQIKTVEEIEKEQKKIKVEKEKVSLLDSDKLRKFHLKRKFMTPKEIQENLKRMETETIIEKMDQQKETLNVDNNNDYGMESMKTMKKSSSSQKKK